MSRFGLFGAPNKLRMMSCLHQTSRAQEKQILSLFGEASVEYALAYPVRIELIRLGASFYSASRSAYSATEQSLFGPDSAYPAENLVYLAPRLTCEMCNKTQESRGAYSATCLIMRTGYGRKTKDQAWDRNRAQSFRLSVSSGSQNSKRVGQSKSAQLLEIYPMEGSDGFQWRG